ncbi:arsenate reductase [Serratia fonticola]|uniref:Arsenate reductase n=1 Tax=Serratia fonticola TaxID=47917 RepID=A0A4U9UT58_SERFO|nr:arsenate reductase [Serratia fonticola]
MKNVTIYHNPRCSKSRETLTLLEQHGVEPQVVLYLDTPPSVAELKKLLQELGFTSARELMRKKEDLYKELDLADETLSGRTTAASDGEQSETDRTPNRGQRRQSPHWQATRAGVGDFCDPVTASRAIIRPAAVFTTVYALFPGQLATPTR